jgi:hypothetical protein
MSLDGELSSPPLQTIGGSSTTRLCMTVSVNAHGNKNGSYKERTDDAEEQLISPSRH